MWLILVCYMGCGMGYCPIENARAVDWSAELALRGIPARGGCYVPDVGRMEGFENDVTQWLDGGFASRYLTQQECLRALKQELPYRDDSSPYPGGGWEVSVVTHHRDHVETYDAVGRDDNTHMMRSEMYACFQEAPLVG